MKKTTLIIFCVFAFVMFGAERETDIPITGGFGVKLGEVLTPQLIAKLNAKKGKFTNNTVIGYKFKLKKEFCGFKTCSIFPNKENKIYQIQLLNITLKPNNSFSDAVYFYQQKYGSVSNIKNEVLYIDKQKKTRTVKIAMGDTFVSIVYIDTSVKNREREDVDI